MLIKNLIKKFLSTLGYRIDSLNSWYNKQENFLAEIEKQDSNFLKQINKYTMTTPANHWAIIQAINHIKKYKIEGDLVECGVYKGGNIILFDYLKNKFSLKKKIYAYDTFDGMTEPGTYDEDLKNKSAKLTKLKYENNNMKWCYSSLDEVKKNISKFNKDINTSFKFIKGDVENTLNDQNNLPQKISLLRLDTDFYNSTKKELEVLYPRLEKNGILIIDDYGHWQGARKAVDEYFETKKKFLWFHRIDYASRLLIKK